MMAGRPTANEAELVPSESPAGADYDRDFYSWSLEQARLLREGRWNAVDRDNVAEEIESLGREQFDKLASALRVLMLHMLKWDHQPSPRSRRWLLSIKAQRADLSDVISDNPGLIPAFGKHDSWVLGFGESRGVIHFYLNGLIREGGNERSDWTSR